MKVDGDDQDTILLYFAFGANMCPSVFTSKRGVKPLISLPAEALRFTSSARKKWDGIDDRVSGEGSTDDRSRQAEICVCFCHRAGMIVSTLDHHDSHRRCNRFDTLHHLLH